MYLVKRGRSEDSIDQALARQASANGVGIIYESNLNIAQADVVACGIKNPSFIAMGLKFPFNYPDKSIVLLDDTLSNAGYEKLIELLKNTNPVIQKLMGGKDLRHILKRIYNHSLSKLLRFLLSC